MDTDASKCVFVHDCVHECMFISLIDIISVQLGYSSLPRPEITQKKAEWAKFSAVRAALSYDSQVKPTPICIFPATPTDPLGSCSCGSSPEDLAVQGQNNERMLLSL